MYTDNSTQSRHLQPGTNHRKLPTRPLSYTWTVGRNIRVVYVPKQFQKLHRTMFLFLAISATIVNELTDTHNISWRQGSLHGSQVKSHSHLGDRACHGK